MPRKHPIFLDDIADLLDPHKIRQQIYNFNIANVHEYVYKLARTLGELLKATIELNDNVQTLNNNVQILNRNVDLMVNEIRKMGDSINELKSVMSFDYGEDSGDD